MEGVHRFSLQGREPLSLQDVDRLYLEFAPALEHIVRRGARASDAVVEDACQAAWLTLIRHRDHIPDRAARGWLARAALYEAFRLQRRELREPAWDLESEDEKTDLKHPAGPDPCHVLEQRQRLACVSRLPVRQQRLIWLRALGFHYEEIATHEGCTTRTVERQLERARRRLSRFEVGAGGGQMRRAA